MIEGIDYNVNPEPFPPEKTSPLTDQKMASWKEWLESPEYAAREAKRIEAELNQLEDITFDPEDENWNNKESHEQ